MSEAALKQRFRVSDSFVPFFPQLEDSVQGIRNRLSMTTTFAFLAIYVAVASVPQFLEDRELYLQELDTAFYFTWPYWLTYLLIEGIYCTIITTIVMVSLGWALLGVSNPH